MTDLAAALERATIRQRIAANLEERDQLLEKLNANRHELAVLFTTGRAVLSIQQLARAADMPRETVYAYLRGDVPDVRRGRPKGDPT